jgi:hypothetical protein
MESISQYVIMSCFISHFLLNLGMVVLIYYARRFVRILRTRVRCTSMSLVMFIHKRIAAHGISPPFHIRVSWLISSAKFLNRLHIVYVPGPNTRTTLIALFATFTADVKSNFLHCVFLLL